MSESKVPDGFSVDGVSVSSAQFMATALSPAHSVVIRACAGSGKTWLLVARVVRLMLAGVEPASILAITFTRKAANEMRARLAQILEKLALCSEEDLLAELRARAVAEEDLAAAAGMARGLLEKVLGASQSMTIDTFHGWFGQIVRNAPLAAGIPAGFALTERTSTLYQQARQGFFGRLRHDERLRAAYTHLLASVGEKNALDLLHSFWRRRNDWRCFLEGQSRASALASLARQLGVVPGDRDARALLLEDADFRRLVAMLVSAFEAGTPSEEERARAAGAALTDGEADAAARIAAIARLVLTKKGLGRSPPSKASQARAQALLGSEGGDLRDACARLMQEIEAVQETASEQASYALNESVWLCADAVLEEYQARKNAAGVLDFDDLEWGAYALLADDANAAYVQTRLDARYSHLLIDEFQDTNALQWRALLSWLESYGADQAAPRVFLVGDPAQSIYRFRRADARLFGEAEQFLRRQFDARSLRTTQTRRCAPAIVEFLNQVFDEPDNAGFEAHHASRESDGAVLCLSPQVAVKASAAPARAPEELRDLLEQALEDAAARPRELLSTDVARVLRSLVGSPCVTDAKTQMRGAQWRDMLVLVRRRSFMPAVEHALRAHGIPYLSDRSGGLLATLEASDLIALLRFLAVPFSDLDLAHVLRTPIFGFSDDDLIALAIHRDDTAIWRLRLEAAGAPPHWQAAARLLTRWSQLAGILPVHDLLDRIYHEGQVIERYCTHLPVQLRLALSEQTRANLLEFLALALDLDSGRYPSLSRFIDELAELAQVGENEAPAEGETDFGDAVRILTIHGAKGLEAPIVVLPDTVREREPNDTYDVLLDWPAQSPVPTHFSVYGNQGTRGQARAAQFAREGALAAQEDWNLLYVAATRARDRLILAGCASSSDALAGSWYARCAAHAQLISVPTAQGLDPPGFDQSQVAVRDFRPAALGRGSRHARELAQKDALELAADRGIALHRLFELVTDARGRRSNPLTLARAMGLNEAMAKELAGIAQTVLTSPALARFFDSSQYLRADNEIEFIGAAGDLVRLDRVVEFDDEVWILDYKSALSQRGALLHEDQLQEYLRVLQDVYRGKRLRAAVIFADGKLSEIAVRELPG